MPTAHDSRPDHVHGPSSRETSGDGKRVDPVCGMAVESATAEHRTEYAGQDYVFCSAGCRAKFVAAPDRYVGKKPQATPAPAGTIYTCPIAPRDPSGGAGFLSDLRHGAGA